MIRSSIFSALFFLFAVVGNASTTWNIQDNIYEVDTVYHAQIGPGTTQTSLNLNGATKQKLYYLTVNLDDKYVGIKTIVAQDIVNGVDNTVQEMGKSHSFPGSRCFAGVNGDFYAQKVPIGANVVFGEIFNTPVVDIWHQFGFDDNKVPYTGSATITGSIKVNDKEVVLNSVNMPRLDCPMTIYTDRYNKARISGGYPNATEIVIIPESGATIILGETIKAVVSGMPITGGGMSIPQGAFVLSGVNDAATFISALKENDKVEITTDVSFNGNIVPNIQQMIGGQPMILSNGEVLNTDDAIDHLPSANPRTAIGYTADKKRLIMLVVDGRSQTAAGCSSKQLADMMKNIGCTEALNLDGGGSSVMYIDSLGVRNIPSDGNERLVSNSIFAYHTAPESNVVESVKFVEWAKQIPKNSVFKPHFYGYNKYGVLIDTDLQGVTLTCSNLNGEIIDGNSFVSNVVGGYTLEAHFADKTTSIVVDVLECSNIKMRLSSVMLDGFKKYSAELISSINGVDYPLNPNSFKWSVDDSNIASVSDNGEIIGLKNGETVVHATSGGVNYDVAVIVQIPEKRVMPLETKYDFASWSFTQGGGKNLISTQFENGLKATFTGSSTRNAYLRMSKKLQLWSLPDTIRIRVNRSGLSLSKVIISTSTPIQSTVNSIIEFPEIWDNQITLDLPTDKWCDVSDMGNYPITLNYIQFDMKSPVVGTEYILEIPGLETVYNEVDKSGVEIIETDVMYPIIYPNPVSAGESAYIKINKNGDNKVNVKIYNSASQLVGNLALPVTDNIVQLPATELSPGLYFVVINSKVIKMVII